MNKEELVQWFIERPSYLREGKAKLAADRLNLDIEFVRECFREAREKAGIKFKEKGTDRLIDTLDKYGMQLSDVKRFIAWGDKDEPMYSIMPTDEWLRGDQETFIQKIREAIVDYKFPVFEPKKFESTDCIGVLNLLDAHIDKLCLVRETGFGSSLQENVEMFEKAFDSILSQTLCNNPEYIIIVVGSDFYNANDANNTTKKGTPQNSDPNWKDSFLEGFKLYRRCIDKALQHTSVILKVVSGNHDEDKIFYLGQMLEVTYENTPNISIDSMCKQRKYHNYGTNLIGFAHGDIEKKHLTTLPATMMVENKHLMPQVEHLHFYLGDIHHRHGTHFDISKDLKGCEVTFLRALSNLSKWEFKEGYIGIPKTAECFIHHKTRGMINNIRVHI